MAEAGWYHDPHEPGHIRYFDGAQWTQHSQPSQPTASPTPGGYGQPSQQSYANAGGPWPAGSGQPAAGAVSPNRRRNIIVIAIVVALLAAGGVLGGILGSSSSAAKKSANSQQPGSSQQPTSPPTPTGPAPTMSPPSGPSSVAFTPTAKPPLGLVETITCASSSFCMATGDAAIQSSHPGQPVSTVWKGSAWSAPKQFPSGLKGPLDVFHQISCASRTFCAAILTGIGTGSQTDYATIWNGSSWGAPKAMPLLSSVACPAPGFCLAIGSDVYDEYKNGNWVQSRYPNLIDPGEDVACSSPTRCLGDFGPPTVTWNGKTWQESLPQYNVPLAAALDISCAGNRCMAIGPASQNPGAPSDSAALYQNGQWSNAVAIDTTPTTGGGSLKHVTCASATVCVAISTTNSLFIWAHGSWTTTSLPPAPFGNLSDVSCAKTVCIVGTAYGQTYEANIS